MNENNIGTKIAVRFKNNYAEKETQRSAYYVNNSRSGYIADAKLFDNEELAHDEMLKNMQFMKEMERKYPNHNYTGAIKHRTKSNYEYIKVYVMDEETYLSLLKEVGR